MLGKRAMSAHSILEPWWMKPGLDSLCHYVVWTLTKVQKTHSLGLPLCTTIARLRQRTDPKR